MRVAAMQPTYLPWLGYFDLMDRVDGFVLLDDVAFSRRSWQQRNRIKTRDGLRWLTLSVLHGERGRETLDTVRLAEPREAERHARTLRHAYARAPYARPYLDALAEGHERGFASGRLAQLNAELIALLAHGLAVRTPLIRASDLAQPGQRGTHLAHICEKLGAHTYVSPPGAATYLAEDAPAFEERGIDIEIHGYEHPVYDQLHPPFASHASALDALLNLGPGAGEVMRSGRRANTPLEAGS